MLFFALNDIILTKKIGNPTAIPQAFPSLEPFRVFLSKGEVVFLRTFYSVIVCLGQLRSPYYQHLHRTLLVGFSPLYC